jgi:hypothetical protein
MDVMLASGQSTNRAKYGILEIHLDESGRLVESTGYGMRLDHRRTNWGELEHVRTPHGDLAAWDACFDDLIDGRESPECHHDRVRDDPEIVAVAERAQDLSLELLGGRS